MRRSLTWFLYGEIMPSNKKLNTNKTKQISSEDTNGTEQDVDSHRKRASTSGRILHISIYLYSESSAAEQGILVDNDDKENIQGETRFRGRWIEFSVDSNISGGKCSRSNPVNKWLQCNLPLSRVITGTRIILQHSQKDFGSKNKENWHGFSPRTTRKCKSMVILILIHYSHYSQNLYFIFFGSARRGNIPKRNMKLTS